MLALVSAEKRRMLNNKNMLRIFGYMRSGLKLHKRSYKKISALNLGA